MKYGVNCYCRFCVLVKDAIWKAPYQQTTIRLMNERRQFGLTVDAFHRRIDRTQEVLAQAYSATLIPDVSLCNIELGFWRNDQFSGQKGRALFASPLARRAPRPGSSEDSLFCAPVRVFANRGPAQSLACSQGHPTDLPRAEAFQRGLDQRLMVLSGSLDSPRSILSKPRRLSRITLKSP